MVEEKLRLSEALQLKVWVQCMRLLVFIRAVIRLQVAPVERVNVLLSAALLKLLLPTPAIVVLLTLTEVGVSMEELSANPLLLRVVVRAIIPNAEFGAQRVLAEWLSSLLPELLPRRTPSTLPQEQAGEDVPVRMVFASGLSMMTVFMRFRSVLLVVRRTCELSASMIEPLGRSILVSVQSASV